MEHQYLNRREAAAYVRGKGLPCAPSTLAKLATLGGGPKFRKFGRNVVHTVTDLDAWIVERLSPIKSSTCDPGQSNAHSPHGVRLD